MYYLLFYNLRNKKSFMDIIYANRQLIYGLFSEIWTLEVFNISLKHNEYIFVKIIFSVNNVMFIYSISDAAILSLIACH